MSMTLFTQTATARETRGRRDRSREKDAGLLPRMHVLLMDIELLLRWELDAAEWASNLSRDLPLIFHNCSHLRISFPHFCSMLHKEF